MLFLLLFMLRGILFVDIAYLRKCDLRGDTILYRRCKTGTQLVVKVEPEAMDLIEQLRNKDEHSLYLFPFLNATGAEAYRQYQNALATFQCLLETSVYANGYRCFVKQL